MWTKIETRLLKGGGVLLLTRGICFGRSVSFCDELRVTELGFTSPSLSTAFPPFLTIWGLLLVFVRAGSWSDLIYRAAGALRPEEGRVPR